MEHCHGQMRGTNSALKGFKVERGFPPPNFLFCVFFPLKFLCIPAGKGEQKELFCWTQRHLIQTDLSGDISAELKDDPSLSKVTVPDLLQGGSGSARTTSKGGPGSCVRLQPGIALAGRQHLLAYSQMWRHRPFCSFSGPSNYSSYLHDAEQMVSLPCCSSTPSVVC